MNHPGFSPTYSDGEIYCLLRRVMAERPADPLADVTKPTPTRAPAVTIPGMGVKHELSFDKILQTIRGDIANG